jgi:hypothetical protein
MTLHCDIKGPNLFSLQNSNNKHLVDNFGIIFIYAVNNFLEDKYRDIN